MARLPTAEQLGERPIPRPSTAVARYQPVSGAEAAVGEAVERLGARVENIGERLYARNEQLRREIEAEARRQQEHADAVAAEDATNAARQKMLELATGEAGYLQLRGGEAVKRPLLKEYGDQFKQAISQISAGLTNDNQREKFRLRSDVLNLQYQEDILRHVVQQREVYTKSVYQGTLEVELQEATARWRDPNAVLLSLERINAAISREGERSGWDSAQIKAAQNELAARVHGSVLGQAITSGDVEYAKDYFDRHRSQVDAQTAKVLEASLRQSEQQSLVAGYRAAMLASRDSLAGLQSLEERVLKDEHLDEDRRNLVLGPILSRQDTLRARAERQATQRENQVGRLIDSLNASTLAGFEPNAQQVDAVMAAARGNPELEAEVQRMVGLANTTRAFRMARPEDKQLFLTQAEAQMRLQPGKFDIRALQAMQSIFEAERRAVGTDVVSYGAAQGVVDITPLDLSQPTAAATNLAERASQARSLAQHYRAPYKPLTEQEAASVSAALQKADVDGKRQWFGSLYQATAGDSETYMAIMGQIAGQDSVTAMAGALAGSGLLQGQLASELALRGEAILKPPPTPGRPEKGSLLPLPPENQLRLMFDQRVGSAFSTLPPEAREEHYRTAKAIYAALSARAGDENTAVPEGKRWDEAMKLAMGEIVDHNGPTILPYGWDETRFNDALRAQIRALVASGRLDRSLTADKLADLPLYARDEGVYAFGIGNGGILADKTGRDVEINFLRRMPPEPVGVP